VQRIWPLRKGIRAASRDAASESLVLSELAVLSFVGPPERRAHRQLNSLLSEHRKLSTGNRKLARVGKHSLIVDRVQHRAEPQKAQFRYRANPRSRPKCPANVFPFLHIEAEPARPESHAELCRTFATGW
jgi:hypothetical protein